MVVVVKFKKGTVTLNVDEGLVEDIDTRWGNFAFIKYKGTTVKVSPSGVYVGMYRIEPEDFKDVMDRVKTVSALVKRVSPPPKPLPEWKDWKDALKKLKKSIPGYCVNQYEMYIEVMTKRGIIVHSEWLVKPDPDVGRIAEYILGFRDDFDGVYYVNLNSSVIRKEVEGYNFFQYYDSGRILCNRAVGYDKQNTIISHETVVTSEEKHVKYNELLFGNVESLKDLKIGNILFGAINDNGNFVDYKYEVKWGKGTWKRIYFNDYVGVLSKKGLTTVIPYFDGLYSVLVPWDAPVDPWDKKYSWEVPYKKKKIVNIPFWKDVMRVEYVYPGYFVAGKDFSVVVDLDTMRVAVEYKYKKNYMIGPIVLDVADVDSFSDFLVLLELL